ncbi:Oidioi.mRNA.OKI2018_I69.XSR.g16836.t1.cds [Oikopleura dioica]|uniref:Oidioi.mRNA.OKI2018_I69.XSR.g16836.t1.cds n=1 Tax=Oikopleura dioica TaxID=34765 RepID=A0ABN7SHD6_OIKDI|nr:Oidioi.mRNA.OKI2018_I69.XSR.g16836.t1.cds [Oikopleura dioica]
MNSKFRFFFLLFLQRSVQGVTTECADGSDLCVDTATCEQSDVYDGYTCICPAGEIGNGFEPGFGGDGCTETCDMFTVECSKTFFELTLDKTCSGTYSFLKAENFYIGELDGSGAVQTGCDFADFDSDTRKALVLFDRCNTNIQILGSWIYYTNKISYKSDISGLNFFRPFSVTCKVATLGHTSSITLETASETSIIGEIEDEIIFHEFVALEVINRPAGAADEFRLGERVEIGLDFDDLDQNFDYVINKCWAFSDTNADFFLVGALDDQTNGCPNYDWVTLNDQAESASLTIPSGFTRPNSVSFPVFTFENEASLNINCQIFICGANSADCNIDVSTCFADDLPDLLVSGPLPGLGRKRRRRSLVSGEYDNQNHRTVVGTSLRVNISERLPIFETVPFQNLENAETEIKEDNVQIFEQLHQLLSSMKDVSSTSKGTKNDFSVSLCSLIFASLFRL